MKKKIFFLLILSCMILNLNGFPLKGQNSSVLKSSPSNTTLENLPDLPPFGCFDTKFDGIIVEGSVALNGWALDETMVESVKIYLIQGSSMKYIGDAIFVEGARPDVFLAYPNYPNSTRAGWGHVLLTNYLPGGGYGRYDITAVARDNTGHETILGYKSIQCDNLNASKPFGAIDYPYAGETISGVYCIQGWALTPPPNKIPENGSTLNVIIDNEIIGQAHYNFYREDISRMFPNYLNKDGALAYFYFDTREYSNGLHSMQLVASDNVGNIGGIGSIYFYIHNENLGYRIESLAGVITVKIPDNTISPNQRVILSKTYDPVIDDLFNGITTTIFRISNRIPYGIRINGGYECPQGNIRVTVNIPDDFISLIPSNCGIELFAQVYQDGGMESVESFEIFQSQYDSSEKKLRAILPGWIFSNNRTQDQSFETVLIVAATPGTNLNTVQSSNISATDKAEQCEGAAITCPLESGCDADKISSPFTRKKVRFDPQTGKYRPHLGVDMEAPVGTRIFAIADGVAEVKRGTGYGLYVIIKHDDGSSTLYGHLDKAITWQNKRVLKGELIGRSGGAQGDPNAGTSKGPHLHLDYVPNGEIIMSKYRIDPIPCMGNGNTDGSITVRDDGSDDDDAFEVSLNGILLGHTETGQSNSLAVNNFRPGSALLRITCIEAPDDYGTYQIILKDGLKFIDGSTSVSGVLPEGGTTGYGIIIP